MGRVQDKVAIITGAASGLGFAAARMLLKEGAKVEYVEEEGKKGKQASNITLL